MRKLLVLMILVFSIGCEKEPTIGDFDCTNDQMKKAESEARFCRDSTELFPSYCYRTSISRNCVLKEGFKK